ncbi:MAG: hypothetical protein IKU96_01295 [Alistipes sp.]|nr:hypothetical protein [Alistipes sp.]
MRPTIYIGLGGTGIRAISHAKKLYEDVYGKGNIPNSIAFLAMDFNLKDIDSPSLATPMGDDAVLINYSGSPREHYASRAARGAYRWMFDGNTSSLQNKISDGAGQVRTTGRFYTEYIMTSIEPALARCWQQVSNLTYVNNNGEAVPCEEIDIHIVMSLAGGTGAGSFINIAEMVHRNYGSRAHIIGYGVLHGIFRTIDTTGTQTRRVRENAYSSILDLDYLMSADIHNPIQLDINGGVRTLTGPIFHEFFVIDNVTAVGNIVPNVNSLCEAIGSCLFASSGDMGSTIQGGQSNNRWTQGNYGILHKKGWVQALGGCQVVYKGELLANIYGYRAAIELIRKMRLETADVRESVIGWMEESKVREDEGRDYLIDTIYSPETLGKIKDPRVDINDSIFNTHTEIEKYTNTLVEFPDTKALDILESEKKELLREKLTDILASENGVGAAKQFLATLKSYLLICKREMEAEAAELEQQKSNKEQGVKRALKEYEEYCNRSFLRRTDRGKEEHLGEVTVAAKSTLKTAIEIKRREAARDIFIALLSEVDRYALQISAMDQLLDNLSREYTDCLADAEHEKGSTVFEYDLSYNERINMPFNADEVGLAGFMSTLTTSLLDMDIQKDLKAAIDKYVASLPEAVAYRTKRLIDVINGLDDKEYAILKSNIEAKSSSLLRINNRGQENNDGKPTDLLVREYLISLFCDQGEQCRLETDQAFIRSATGAAGCQFMPNPCEALRQKMFIFRAEYAVIPYCIDAFNDMVVDAYDTQVKASMAAGATAFNPHFDKAMFEEMRKKNFKLEPELPNEAMFYWVCGQIFGFTDVTETCYIMEKESDGTPIKIKSKEDVVHKKYISCRKGKYYFWQEKSNENGKDKKWYPIGGVSTGDRGKAFDNFKAITLAEFKSDLHAFITQLKQTMGSAQIKAIISELRDMGKEDYIDLVLCTDKSSSTYYSQNKKELTQIDDEWAYICDETSGLESAIDNLK